MQHRKRYANRQLTYASMYIVDTQFIAILSDPSFKRLVKIIRSIRDDVSATYPIKQLPDSWTLKCLIASIYKDIPQRSEWHHRVTSVLSTLRTKTANNYPGSTEFYEADGVTPLFPPATKPYKEARIAKSDIYQFATLALAHFQKSQRLRDITPNL